MKTVNQGEKINFQVLFYDKEPSQGGMLIDPDNALNTWRILNERHHHVVSVELFENGLWPGAVTYYFAIQDDPVNSKFEVRAYDTEQARTDAVPGTELVSTGWLNYGVFVQQALNPVASPLFSGNITMTFPAAHNYSWVVSDDLIGYIMSVNLLQAGEWPLAAQFWFDITDTGQGYVIDGYDDDLKTNKILTTGLLAYGPVVNAPFTDVQSLLYAGDITADYPFPGRHEWIKEGDIDGHISDFTLLKNSLWPSQERYWLSIEDMGNGTDYHIRGYGSDADRLARSGALFESGALLYSLEYTDALLTDLSGEFYLGTVSCLYTGIPHSWTKAGDLNGRVGDLQFWYNGSFPPVPQQTYYARIEDDGISEFRVRYYLSDADRNSTLNWIAETLSTPYGSYTNLPVLEVEAGYSGQINIDFPGTGAPVNEDFEITDSGWGIIYKDFEEFDPNFDPTFHFWKKTGDDLDFTSDFSLSENLMWPLQPTFYLSIEDTGNGTDYKIVGYLNDADRMARVNAVIETSTLAYGTPYNDEPFIDILTLGYSGTIDSQYTGESHSWETAGDLNNRISNVVYLYMVAFPPVPQPTYYCRIIDDGLGNFNIKTYLSDADRSSDLNALTETTPQVYGTYLSLTLNDLGSGYDGQFDVDFPGLGAPGFEDFEITDSGWGPVYVDFDETDPHFDGGLLENFSIIQGGGIEHFEITDIGVTQPVYEIWNENNIQVVAETIFPVRVSVGTFETDYSVPIDAVPGENWKLVARGKISGADTFVIVPFRVVDSDEILDESAMLVTLSEVKQFLELYQDDIDGYLIQLIGAASKTVETFTGTLFHNETVNEYFNGEGLNSLHISKGPVKEVIKIENRDFGTNWIEVPITSFIWDTFFIQRIEGGIFDEGLRNWRITYIAGHDRANQQIRLAVKMLVKYWYHTKDRMGVLSDVVGGGLRVNYQEVTEELPPDIKQILRQYRRFV